MPAIDVHEGKAVRLARGRLQEVTVYADDPAEVARGFASEGAPWVHVVDLDAAFGSGENRETIRRVVEAAGVPVQVGGGLRSVEDVAEAMEAGAARAVLGTEAILDPGFLRICLSRFGERIVVAVDIHSGRVRVRGWTQEAGPLDDVMARLESAGAPRYLVTAVARDGTLEGPDLGLYQVILAMTQSPVIASGGVGTLEHLAALRDTGVEAAVVGKALYEGRFTLRDALEAAR